MMISNPEIRPILPPGYINVRWRREMRLTALAGWVRSYWVLSTRVFVLELPQFVASAEQGHIAGLPGAETDRGRTANFAAVL